MSVFFVTNDSRDVLNPSGLAGRLFLSQTELVAREISVENGLGQLISDEVVIDCVQFIAFARAFTEFLLKTHSNSRTRILLAGCYSIVVALSLKLGATIPNIPELEGLVKEGQGVVD